MIKTGASFRKVENVLEGGVKGERDVTNSSGDSFRRGHPHRDCAVREDDAAANARADFDTHEEFLLGETELGDDVEALIEGDLGRAAENGGGGICEVGVGDGAGGA